ncbi:MAG: hypothetical protein PSX36_14340 [bacterium]|nr:hypothetical protein [bacterium]
MKKKKISLINALALLVVLFTMLSFSGEKDPLHKRVFNISLDELKDGVPGKKVIADKLYFKDGKVFSDFLDKKFGYQWIRYRINKDSIYIDSTDVEVRYLQVEASSTNSDNQTVTIEFESLEWDLDGVIKITKNDKIKRYFDFVGREKGGKPKKVKVKKGTKVVEIIRPGEEAKKVHEETIEVPKDKK